MPRQGSFKLLRIAGIDVFVHWSWFFVAVFEINARSGRYSSIAWNVLEYLALFLIVTAHEFGHALASRQVGGKAEHCAVASWRRIVTSLRHLGLAQHFGVSPPGHWSTLRCSRYSSCFGASPAYRDGLCHRRIYIISLGLFSSSISRSMLPIYPLDGGQILRSLLWFVIGRARSLTVTTISGFVGIAGFMAPVTPLGSPLYPCSCF